MTVLRKSLLSLLSLAALSGLGACGKPDPRPALETYAQNLYQMYADSVAGAEALRDRSEALIADPTEEKLAAARKQWLDGRAGYMASEAARFYGGPIDSEDGPEALINSWPLDEAYIDYVTDGGAVDEGQGIVNRVTQFPTIDKALLIAQNAKDGDENISAGYHAIEFLLWGQALTLSGPGQRPASDYKVGVAAPRKNGDRRAAYLRAAIALLIENLTTVRDAWAPGKENYRAAFVAGGLPSVGKILTGLGKMSKGELGGERMNAAYESKERHDQHNCFSSTTILDYTRNAEGIRDAYLGRYGAADGPGVDELVRATDAALDERLRGQLQASVDAMKAVPAPFEDAIAGPDSAPGRKQMRVTIDALRAQADTIVDAAAALGLQIAVPEKNP